MQVKMTGVAQSPEFCKSDSNPHYGFYFLSTQRTRHLRLAQVQVSTQREKGLNATGVFFRALSA